MYACAALVGLATGIARPCEDGDGLSQLELVKIVKACLLLEVRFRGHSKARDKASFIREVANDLAGRAAPADRAAPAAYWSRTWSVTRPSVASGDGTVARVRFP